MDGDAIVAVQVRAGLKGYEITSCARIDGRKGIKPEENLKTLLEAEDFRSDRFVIQIPDKAVFFRNLSMPFKDRKKIRQTLPFEMETLVPLPIEALVTDFVATDSSDSARVLTASATKEFIMEFLAMLQPFGIIPDILDVRGAALASSVVNQGGTVDHGLVLDIGAASACMSLFIHRQTVLIRILSFREAFLPKIPTSRNGTVAQALPEEEVETYFRSLCSAINDTIHDYRYTSSEFSAPEKVFFTGPGALLPYCADFLSRFLEIPAVEIDLCAENRIRIAEETAENWHPALMSTALSLAMRGAGKGVGFNLLQEEFKVKKSLFKNTKQWRTAAVFLLVNPAFSWRRHGR